MRLKPRLQRHTVRLRGHQRLPRRQSRALALRLHERWSPRRRTSC